MELELDTMHTSTASTTSSAQMIYGAALPLMDGVGSMEIDDLQLPTSLDDLQTYIPLMYTNPNASMQHGFLSMQQSEGDLGGFSDPSAYSYSQPPAPGGIALAGIPPQFPPVTHPPWPP